MKKQVAIRRNSKVAITADNLITDEGLIRGVVLRRTKSKGHMYYGIQAKYDQHKRKPSLSICRNVGQDFYATYSDIVHRVAAHFGIKETNPLFHSLMETDSAFLRYYGLEVETRTQHVLVVAKPKVKAKVVKARK